MFVDLSSHLQDRFWFSASDLTCKLLQLAKCPAALAENTVIQLECNRLLQIEEYAHRMGDSLPPACIK